MSVSGSVARSVGTCVLPHVPHVASKAGDREKLGTDYGYTGVYRGYYPIFLGLCRMETTIL